MKVFLQCFLWLGTRGLSRTCRLVLSHTLRIITMNKSLNILFIYIKKEKKKTTIFPNLNAKSADFPVTGAVIL